MGRRSCFKKCIAVRSLHLINREALHWFSTIKIWAFSSNRNTVMPVRNLHQNPFDEVILGSGRAKHSPVKGLCQKEGCFLALNRCFRGWKRAFKKSGNSLLRSENLKGGSRDKHLIHGQRNKGHVFGPHFALLKRVQFYILVVSCKLNGLFFTLEEA